MFHPISFIDCFLIFLSFLLIRELVRCKDLVVAYIFADHGSTLVSSSKSCYLAVVSILTKIPRGSQFRGTENIEGDPVVMTPPSSLSLMLICKIDATVSDAPHKRPKAKHRE